MILAYILIVLGLSVVLYALFENSNNHIRDQNLTALKQYTSDYINKYIPMLDSSPRIPSDAQILQYLNAPPDVGRGQTKTNKVVESKGEAECRRVLEKIFNKQFVKARPTFLNNDVTEQNLELDCYSPELQLACEYQGQAHYHYIPHFHKNQEAFKNQQYRDYMKQQKCKENGITLLTVPYTVPVKDIEHYIILQLQNKKKQLP
jgi:hypothetical protein